MPHVNPEIIRWARETAGYSPEEAVDRLGLREARGRTAVERLEALETGTVEPSRAQLVKMAREYRRPLVTFYMTTPPRKGDRGEDFRTLPDARSPSEDARVDVLLRDIRARQSMVRALLEDEEARRLPFVGGYGLETGVEKLVTVMREILKPEEVELAGQNLATNDFEVLRASVEKAGIFVLLIGNLGSYHTAFDTNIFRGFALADPIAPFIVINDQDARRAWSFTLLHEFAHILIGASGVSGSTKMISRDDKLSRIEIFCNDVASEFLLPARDLERVHISVDMPVDDIISRISEFAEGRNISNSMVAYRVYRAGFISREKWLNVSEAFRAYWIQAQDDKRIKARESEGGPDYYVVKRHRVGGALINLVQRTLRERAITPTKAAKILGVKPSNVETLIGGAGKRAA